MCPKYDRRSWRNLHFLWGKSNPHFCNYPSINWKCFTSLLACQKKITSSMWKGITPSIGGWLGISNIPNIIVWFTLLLRSSCTCIHCALIKNTIKIDWMSLVLEFETMWKKSFWNSNFLGDFPLELTKLLKHTWWHWVSKEQVWVLYIIIGFWFQNA